MMSRSDMLITKENWQGHIYVRFENGKSMQEWRGKSARILFKWIMRAVFHDNDIKKRNEEQRERESYWIV